MNYILAQGIGILVAVFSLSYVQFKDKRLILARQFLNNVLFGVSWGLLGELAGAWICLLASVQILTLYFVGKAEEGVVFRRKLVVTAILQQSTSPEPALHSKASPTLQSVPAPCCSPSPSSSGTQAECVVSCSAA